MMLNFKKSSLDYSSDFGIFEKVVRYATKL